MSWIRVPIVNCKSASIRRTPWIPICEDDVVGIRDGPTENESDLIVKTGEHIEIDPDQYVYSWADRKFYKVRNPDGWIYEGCVDLGDDS